MPIGDKVWIEEWAEKYNYNEGDVDREKRIFKSIEDLGPRSSCLPKPVFLEIVRWKSPRSFGYARKNDARFVEDVTRVSFSTKNEELKIGVLTLMKGVEHSVASAILYFRYPKQYPIMDWRAWASLKDIGEVDGDSQDTFESWQEYVKVCRRIAKENKVDLRTLDKALWKYKGGVTR